MPEPEYPYRMYWEFPNSKKPEVRNILVKTADNPDQAAIDDANSWLRKTYEGRTSKLASLRLYKVVEGTQEIDPFCKNFPLRIGRGTSLPYTLDHVITRVLWAMGVEQSYPGGYLARLDKALFDDEPGLTLASLPFGTVPARKEAEFQIALARQLFCLLYDPGRQSSWQLGQKESGGAIRSDTDACFYAIIGLTSEGNEAAALYLAVLQDDLEADRAYEIAEISQNSVYFCLMQNEEVLQVE